MAHRFADMQTFPAPRRPMTRFPIRSENPNGWQMQRFADMQMFRDGTFPSPVGHVATTTLLAGMQTLLLPDALEDLCSPN